MRAGLISLCLVAIVAACGERGQPAVEASAPPPVQDIAAAPPPPPPSGLTPSPAPANCDRPARPIATGGEIQGEIEATTAGYPANARYFCFSVPAGESLATLRLTGLTADLDLYVGHGAIDTVQGVDLSAGENYEWKSNAFGSVDETVMISQPEAGIYYVEIVSYEGTHSPFTLSVR